MNIRREDAAAVIVYTTPNCGFCVRAKQILAQLGIPFKEIGLELDPELRQRLSEENNGFRTVPMIYVEGKFVGGYEQLAKLHRAGQLDHLRAP
jgi:glutaredoxin 3